MLSKNYIVFLYNSIAWSQCCWVFKIEPPILLLPIELFHIDQVKHYEVDYHLVIIFDKSTARTGSTFGV